MIYFVAVPKMSGLNTGYLNTASSAIQPPSLQLAWSFPARTMHRRATRNGTAIDIAPQNKAASANPVIVKNFTCKSAFMVVSVVSRIADHHP